jgi:F-type H+-transporting ATPase subunit gamma
MANLRDLRRRIRSVRNTQQIFKAMKTVSASRLRRAQDAILAARPYSRKLQEVLSSAASRAQAGLHPLLEERPAGTCEVVVVSADRGLCGSFNGNVVRRAAAFASQQDEGRLRGLHLIGRKGRDYFRRRRLPILSERIDQYRGLDYERAAAIARELAQRFTSRQVDSIHVIYNEFKSVAQQRVVVERLLPVERAELSRRHRPLDYLYEPQPQELLARLLPVHVQFQFFRVLLESVAAEQAARMAAMDAASRNAGDMITGLTMHLNRVRQAAITKELIEVVSGAEALV